MTEKKKILIINMEYGKGAEQLNTLLNERGYNSEVFKATGFGEARGALPAAQKANPDVIVILSNGENMNEALYIPACRDIFPVNAPMIINGDVLFAKKEPLRKAGVECSNHYLNDEAGIAALTEQVVSIAEYGLGQGTARAQ